MRAKIIQHPKSSMQNSPISNKSWYIEYEHEKSADYPDKVMGWLSSTDTTDQVHLSFDSLDAAVAYAESEGIEYEVIESSTKKMTKKSYADNFK